MMLNKSGRYEPIFYFSVIYPGIEDDIAKCKENNIQFTGSRVFSIQFLRNNKVSTYKQMIGYFFTHIPLPKNNLLYRTCEHITLLQSDIKEIRRSLKHYNISLVVLAGDNLGYDTAAIVKASHLENLMAVIIPSWMASSLEPAEAYFLEPFYSLDNIDNRLISKLFPRWAYVHKGHGMLRLPAHKVLAMEIIKIAPPKPWILHSGFADAIAVPSLAMKKLGVIWGLPENKLIPTGSMEDDIMASQLDNTLKLREELYHNLGMPSDRPMILCAIPPDMLYNRGRPECTFSRYKELVDFWVSTLESLKEYNIIISLHPSLKYNDMKYLEKENIHISQERIIKLIPLCNIFVASISSTIAWAISCGKPVVNYDVYKYRYTDYSGVRGVLYTEDSSEFKAIIHKLAEDSSYYNTNRYEQSLISKDWGFLDNKCRERLLSLFDYLIINRNVTGIHKNEGNLHEQKDT